MKVGHTGQRCSFPAEFGDCEKVQAFGLHKDGTPRDLPSIFGEAHPPKISGAPNKPGPGGRRSPVGPW